MIEKLKMIVLNKTQNDENMSAANKRPKRSQKTVKKKLDKTKKHKSLKMGNFQQKNETNVNVTESKTVYVAFEFVIRSAPEAVLKGDCPSDEAAKMEELLLLLLPPPLLFMQFVLRARALFDDF